VASAEVPADNEGLGAKPSVWSSCKVPIQEVRGRSTLKLTVF
jgi:hypothetical protein